MPLGSFLDNSSVVWAIVGGYLVLMFMIWAFARAREPSPPGWEPGERGPQRAFGCITGIGLAFLLGAMALTDWLIDHVF